MPFTSCLTYKVPDDVARSVWVTLGEAGVFITRANGEAFTFAAGQTATIKTDAERLFENPALRPRALAYYASHPCVSGADAISFVPNGTATIAADIARMLGRPFVSLVRAKGAPRADMRFVSDEDVATIRRVSSVCLIEDVSSTGFSAHAAAAVLRRVNPRLVVHSVSLLQRHPVDRPYEEGSGAVAYHTFVRQDVPLDVAAFRATFPGMRVQTVPT